jgi:hypothetical protein
MVKLLILFFLILAHSAPVFGKNLEAQAILLSSFMNHHEAIALAKQASYRLRYPLARDNMEPPLKFPSYPGRTVQIIQPLPDTFQVIAYLGFDFLRSKKALLEIKKFFPQAKLLSLKLDPSETDPSYLSPSRKRVLILGQRDSFQEARALAEDLSQKSGIPFATRGMVFDPAKGWAWPEDDPDLIQAGVYFARKHNKECDGKQVECITLERSDFFLGFNQGRFLILGGVFETGDLRSKPMLKRLKKITSQAYLQTTEIQLGCAP